MFGLPAGPIIMYFSLVDLTASQIRATCQMLLFAVSIEHMAVLYIEGHIDLREWQQYLLNVVCGVGGLAVGNCLHQRIDKLAAKRFLHCLLVVTGCMMLGETHPLRTFLVAGGAAAAVAAFYYRARWQPAAAPGVV